MPFVLHRALLALWYITTLALYASNTELKWSEIPVLVASYRHRPDSGTFRARQAQAPHPIELWRMRTKRPVIQQSPRCVDPSELLSYCPLQDHLALRREIFTDGARTTYDYYLTNQERTDALTKQRASATQQNRGALIAQNRSCVSPIPHETYDLYETYDFFDPMYSSVHVSTATTCHSRRFPKWAIPLGPHDTSTCAHYNVDTHTLYHRPLSTLGPSSPCYRVPEATERYSRYTHMGPILADDGTIAGRFFLIALLYPNFSYNPSSSLQGGYLLIHPHHRAPFILMLPDAVSPTSATRTPPQSTYRYESVGTHLFGAYNYHTTKLSLEYEWFRRRPFNRTVSLTPIKRVEIELPQLDTEIP